MASVTKLLTVPVKKSSVIFDTSDNMEVDPDPDGLEFVGSYMADLKIDHAVWMAGPLF